MAWKADLLQGVAFPLPSTPQIDAFEAFNLAFGNAPEGYQKPGNSPISVSQANGPLGENTFVIQSQIGRIDFMLSNQGNETSLAEFTREPPRIEDFNLALNQLVDAMMKALEKVKLNRIAIVCNASEFCSDEGAASRKLTERTGGVWFPSPATDCIYQFNVRRAFERQPFYEMNRIVTFNGGSRRMAALNMLEAMPGLSAIQKVIPTVIMKIDTNSHTSSEISQHVTSLLLELSEEVKLLFEEGIGRLKS